MKPWSHVGKQVFLRDAHFCDAVDQESAAMLVDWMNAYFAIVNKG